MSLIKSPLADTSNLLLLPHLLPKVVEQFNLNLTNFGFRQINRLSRTKMCVLPDILIYLLYLSKILIDDDISKTSYNWPEKLTQQSTYLVLAIALIVISTPLRDAWSAVYAEVSRTSLNSWTLFSMCRALTSLESHYVLLNK